MRHASLLQKPLATARLPRRSPWRRRVRAEQEIGCNVTLPQSHVDFSGVLRPRKSTSEKSTQSDPHPKQRLRERTKKPSPGGTDSLVAKSADGGILMIRARIDD